ncbi:hypothetical protein [Psychroflexus halocasei]|nr:hypothetical protein [Psychroflexus halocasei]
MLDIGAECDSNSDGIYDGTVSEFCQCNNAANETDCEDLQLNIGDQCDSNGDGTLDGNVNDSCECIPKNSVIDTCPGYIQNGDFEIITGNPNTSVDQDIDLATHWKKLWVSGSKADLFDETTLEYGASCFEGPTPSSGVFAGMWIENSSTTDATYREGMFNEMSQKIYENSGLYNLSFDYALMSGNCSTSNNVKIGVYGINYSSSDPLPATPTGIGTPSNLDLFGTTNTVFLGEIVISSTTTNTWQSINITIDTSSLTFPTDGINHIMITNSHLPLDEYGKMFVGFDNFCLINQ